MRPEFVTDGKKIILVRRRFQLLAGDPPLHGHKHHVDHVMLVEKGIVQLKWEGGIAQSADHLLVKAGVYHEISAITDCQWSCVFLTPPGLEEKYYEFWGDADDV